MSKTETLLDKLNLLHDSKLGGYVSSTIFSEVLNDTNDLFCMQSFNKQNTKDQIESYKALLPGSSKLFSYEHVGLEKSLSLIHI